MSSHAIRLTTRAPVPVAVIRRLVPPPDLGRAVQSACGAVWQELRTQGLHGGRHVAIYLDGRITLEAGVECDLPFLERAGVCRSTTPGGLIASVTHLGPYATLGRAHEAIHAWARATGHRLPGPRWETYGHWQAAWEADPGAIETEVAYLVAPA
ncbi:MAG: GyrI-like domain-containing protein [Gemmatimonadales bacterium]|nr:GyrI-like domain-containing protein [Gemmatimonadales bacterium]MBP9200311.1 GyrI-like domain-containing protein [Gemmatimonadales bacterium]